MKVQKRNGFDIGLMLKKLSELRTLQSDGSIALSGLGTLDKYESYFRTAISVEGKSDAFIGSVVRKAMNAEQDLDEAEFIKHVKRIANIKEQTACKKYKVVFPVWGSKGLISGNRRWHDVSITFDASQKSRFVHRAKLDRTKQLQSRESHELTNMSGFESLPLAICTVQAIDVRDAFELAENAISIELGLYSLLESRGQYLWGTGSSQPISTVLLAPYMTVHESSGAMSVDMFWYNQWPSGLREKHKTRENSVKLQARVEMFRKRIRKVPWRDMAEMALARHYAAFSQKDLEASFLDGWRLLESIGGRPREKGEILVKRAAWFFEDRQEMYQIGLHLMHRRNLISHGRPVRADDNERLAFQMKEFLTPIFRAVLTNPFSFKDIDEFWKFCDLPTDRASRERQIYLLESGATFRREN